MNENDQNINDELDDLKSLWKNQPDEKSYGQQEIFKMIHRKSINSVQWLFIITILEFLFGLGMSLWTIFSGNHMYSDEKIKTMGVETVSRFENLSHFGLIGSIIILSITFFYYRKISSSLSVNELMKSIMNFRKMVMWFIVIWFVFMLMLFSPVIMEMGVNTYINTKSTQNISPETLQNKASQIGYIFVTIMIVLLLIFSLLYYGIIYGIFLRRLGKNLKELKKIEN